MSLFGREIEAAQWRAYLLQRLEEEEEWELHGRLEKCGKPMSLWCRSCGHEHHAAIKCCRKWCPSCAPKRANERAAKMKMAVRIMKWPMWITLTTVNETPGVYRPTLLREFVQAFRKLKARKIWTKNVKGGVRSIEITDKGNGLHPHMHLLLDCRWLSLHIPPPHHGDDIATLRDKFRCAAEEITAEWRDCVGDQRIRNVDICRCDVGAVNDIIKYALKNEDVQNCLHRIGPILHMLDSIRTVSTFGNLHGLKLPPEKKSPLECPCGAAAWTPDMPLEILHARRLSALREARAQETAHHAAVTAAFVARCNAETRAIAVSRGLVTA